MAQPNGAILYEGPSLFDGAPIVVIVTGLATLSANDKTGAMLQTWILRSDLAPRAALESGNDASICGGCIHRGVGGKNRSCYVRIDNAPRAVWDAYQRGIYPRAHPSMVEGRKLRMGSYGDPAAVPWAVWEPYVRAAAGITGYTHAAERIDVAPELAGACMTSCDSLQQARAAWARGERTFRVLRDGEQPVRGVEIVCPASKEAGKRTTCAECLLCGGNGVAARNVTIRAHGSGAVHFRERA